MGAGSTREKNTANYLNHQSALFAGRARSHSDVATTDVSCTTVGAKLARDEAGKRYAGSAEDALSLAGFSFNEAGRPEPGQGATQAEMGVGFYDVVFIAELDDGQVVKTSVSCDEDPATYRHRRCGTDCP